MLFPVGPALHGRYGVVCGAWRPLWTDLTGQPAPPEPHRVNLSGANLSHAELWDANLPTST